MLGLGGRWLTTREIGVGGLGGHCCDCSSDAPITLSSNPISSGRWYKGLWVPVSVVRPYVCLPNRHASKRNLVHLAKALEANPFTEPIPPPRAELEPEDAAAAIPDLLAG